MTTPPPPPHDRPPATGRGLPWLEATFAAHHRDVRRYAARRVGPDEADDVVSEVFATAWRRRDDVPHQALPWLYRAAAHHIQHSRRGEARRGRLTSRALALVGRNEADGDRFDEVDAALDDAARARSVLDRLSPDDAEILRLVAWEQLGPTDIALVLGCSPDAARTRLRRARVRGARVLADLDAGAELDELSSPRAAFAARSAHRTCQGES